ncbi:MAG: ABC transporter permease subunit [Planctomycetia bacterium]
MRKIEQTGNCWSRWRAAGWVARRELLEFVRDRRTLVITLLLPMVSYPILALATTLGLRTATIEAEARHAPTKITVAVSGPDAQGFIDRVRSVIDATDSKDRVGWPSEAVFEEVPQAIAHEVIDSGAADLWLHAEAGVAGKLDGRGTVPLAVQASIIQPPTSAERLQFLALMESFAKEMRRRRIEAEGLPDSVLEPIEVRIVGELPKEDLPVGEIVNTVAGGVLVLLAVLTITGAFYPAIDAIAGEKERGTIETLLIAPCSAHEIVLGKFLAVFAITLATLVANVTSIAGTSGVSLRLLATGPSQSLALATAGGIGVTLVVFVGLAAVGAATCLAVTTAAKSGKEAQNTLTPVILLASSLAGAALLPGMRIDGLLPAAPFVGHVLVSHRAFVGGGDETSIAMPLFLSLASSIVITWLLLRITAFMLTDEDILFRGQDTAGQPLSRPTRREVPTLVQGAIPAIVGLAGLWYAQAFMPQDLLQAIPVQQATTVLLPLGVLLWWQRVDVKKTFSLRRPGRGGSLSACQAVLGAGLLGAGVFVLGAAALLAFRGDALSDEARSLSAKLVGLIRTQPRWLSWLLIAGVPAVCEELLFRGWTLSAFVGRRRTAARVVIAVLAQAFLFAVAHVLPERMPQTFVLGAVLGWITITTGSVVPAIVGHVVHNSMPLGMLMLSGCPPEMMLDAGAGDLSAMSGFPTWAVMAAAIGVAVGAALVQGVAVARRVR